MSLIKLQFPGNLIFGNNCFAHFIEQFSGMEFKNVLIVVDPFIEPHLESLTFELRKAGTKYFIDNKITKEPSVSDFKKLLEKAEKNSIDSVIGIGGGSVLDVSKLAAAICHSGQTVESAFGIGKLKQRKLFLACLPTTAGTGSEVSPNAILLDESDNLKKGIVSPFLVPDYTYVDPVFTHTVPPKVTAATGIDALTHCIEAYANKFAHPLTDMLALEGIRLIYKNLGKAFKNGSDANARENVALGSLYGGMCLGPVNTAAVHALAYPLGSEYNIQHGVSNALLLPHVLYANLESGVKRYATIAEKIGVNTNQSSLSIAKEGVLKIAELCKNVGIPANIIGFGVKKDDVPQLAKSALKVQRLLKNNLRELTVSDIEEIYLKLF
jgi:alcohol dehydrogenase class IV